MRGCRNWNGKGVISETKETNAGRWESDSSRVLKKGDEV